MTYAQVLDRLTEIEGDLSRLEDHADSYFRAKRDWELAWAKTYMQTEGTVEERRQQTLLNLATSESYKKFIVAEAGYEGWKAAYRTLDTRASIGQSLLKAMTREAPQNGRQPEWSS